MTLRCIQGLGLAFLALACWGSAVLAQGRPVTIVCLGDSLTAGYELPANQAFPTVLEQALKPLFGAVHVSNAGVSGDTATGGLERLDWAVPDGTDLVILELGANDMLRGLDPKIPEQALDTILARLQGRKIQVLLAGMLASNNYGADYKARFEAIYPALAKKYHVPLYPFFMAGATGVPGMIKADGLHPTAAGVETVVKGILPMVKQVVAGQT